ncbi:MAG: 50S ribosomal protein L25/general stress protein Ctc [Deltaproteobacteria bacterium]|nr:50S ribosomal protein L25/general stress protein Ctc [Deltaproteobacteria bacterium]
MELIKFKANIRTQTGNGPGRVLRREGQIPGVLYGPNTEPVLLSVDIKELEQILRESKGAQVILELVIQDQEAASRTAILKELQTHPVSQNYLHVDFYEIAMDRKIKANVPVVATGKSVGVEMGGMLQIIRRELEVMCLPLHIPETIEIDITDLDIGDSIHVDEIPLEGDVEIPTDVNFTVLTILSPAKEEEEEVEEEEVEEGAEEEDASTDDAEE